MNQVANSTRLRLTTRGKVVIALFIGALTLVALFFALSLGAPTAQADEGGAQVTQFESVAVMPGDTLWSIAATVAPSADARDFIFDVAKLNQLTTTELQIGQELAIPLKYTS